MSSYIEAGDCPYCKKSGELYHYDRGKFGYWVHCMKCDEQRKEDEWGINMGIDKIIDERGQVSTEDVLLVRNKTHGDYKKQGAFSIRLKEMVREGDNWKKLSGEQKDALDMIATKVSRVLHGDPNEKDHWRDIAGYATLIAKLVEVMDSDRNS